MRNSKQIAEEKAIIFLAGRLMEITDPGLRGFQEERLKIRLAKLNPNGNNDNMPMEVVYYCCQELRAAVVAATEWDIEMNLIDCIEDEMGERFYCECPFCGTIHIVDEEGMRPIEVGVYKGAIEK